MVGYAGWTMRSTTVVATVPLLADGIKWMGYLPKQRLLYNLGWYTDVLSEGQSFSSYDQQLVARVGYLPILTGRLRGRAAALVHRPRRRGHPRWPVLAPHPHGQLVPERSPAAGAGLRAYGVGQLDRFGVVGTTPFFQTRLQFQF